MPERIRLVVLFGGQSAEHDVSCVSARHVLAAADPDKYTIEPIGISRDGQWHLGESAKAALTAVPPALGDHLTVEHAPVDTSTVLAAADEERTVVFPVLHGPMGEDGTIQGLLDLAGVPYVGAGVLASALCMDKIVAKQMATVHEIPQARWTSLHSDELAADTAAKLLADLGPSVFVKPANLGSSVGISNAVDEPTLTAALDLAASYDEWVVVEEAIDGREIEIAVLGNHHPRASLPGEILPGADFYTYDDKYTDGVAQTVVPADLPDDVSEDMRALAVRAYSALRCEGLARVDFFYEEARGPLLNEINTMPGFTPISMYPKLWAATGLSYPELIDELVGLALARHDRRMAHRRVDH
ncbi:MAG: D-alanine--D-alanine ligase [Acidimicrobiia bacterium]|nr:D-alanine--D-alanine ligase [Acidimicrobiia bacterium]